MPGGEFDKSPAPADLERGRTSINLSALFSDDSRSGVLRA